MVLNNPYDYLGVEKNASEEQIMDAYRKIAGQIQNSGMSESEKQAKMSELDNAYDAVLAEKRGTAAYSNASNSYYEHSGSQFSDVRERINSGRIDDAETILDGIPSSMRTAEWHYLKGIIHHRRGWLNEAYRCYQAACSMDPTNNEYSAAFNALNNAARGGYKTTQKNTSTCDICSGLLCADCCCECLGGDLIPCC